MSSSFGQAVANRLERWARRRAQAGFLSRQLVNLPAQARWFLMQHRLVQGTEGVSQAGHRDYVGGLWDEMGTLQFDFLIAQGLTSSDVLLDIACGSLRGGVRFIRFLEPGNYLGMEKEVELVRRGVKHELGVETYVARKPEIVVSGTFEFARFSKAPTFALAQSLFSHLASSDINLCMKRLRAVVRPGCRFFATFSEVEALKLNPWRSHARMGFDYTRDQMVTFGERWGWEANYIGDWNHPRMQVMVEYLAR
jgi:hypothetical protein